MSNGVLPAGAVRVLTAIAFLQGKGRAITWRNIVKVLRLRSTNSIAPSMRLLHEAGLISSGSVSGKRAWANTIRPACRFITADQLGRE